MEFNEIPQTAQRHHFKKLAAQVSLQDVQQLLQPAGMLFRVLQQAKQQGLTDEEFVVSKPPAEEEAIIRSLTQGQYTTLANVAQAANGFLQDITAWVKGE